MKDNKGGRYGQHKRITALLAAFALFVLSGIVMLAAQEDTVSASTPVTDEAGLHAAFDAIDGAGTVVLGSDIELSGLVTVPDGKAVTLESLEGNAYTLYTPQGSTFRHFQVEDGGSLTLANVTLNGRSTGGGIQVSGGSLTVEDGAVITRCVGDSRGGGVAVLSGGWLDIRGGEISYNTTTSTSSSGGYSCMRVQVR